MNTGIQDAHNLAWKLAAALKPSFFSSSNHETPNNAAKSCNWPPTSGKEGAALHSKVHTAFSSPSNQPTPKHAAEACIPRTTDDRQEHREVNTASNQAAEACKSPPMESIDAHRQGGTRCITDKIVRSCEELLDSYQAERRPVAVANTALSIVNWEETLLVCVLTTDRSYRTGSKYLTQLIYEQGAYRPDKYT